MSLTKEIMPSYDEHYLSVQCKIYNQIGYRYVVRIISSFIDQYAKEGNHVLDVGCGGIGWLLRAANDAGCITYGIDFSKSAITTTKAKLKGVNLVVSDAHHFPFREESFELIFSIWLLEHVVKPEQVLTEMFRTLKVGGLAIVMAPSGELIHTRKLSPEPTKVSPSACMLRKLHFWEFSPVELQNLLERIGFVIRERRGLYSCGLWNLFTFPAQKLFSPSIRAHHSNDEDVSFISIKKTIECAFKRFIKTIERFMPPSFSLILLNSVFNFFLKIEMHLGNKSPFNFFGINTLMVGQKSYKPAHF